MHEGRRKTFKKAATERAPTFKHDDNFAFANSVPFAFSTFRPPKIGDVVVAPFGELGDLWPPGEAKTLEATRAHCSCYTCTHKGSCGSITLRITRESHQYASSNAFEDVRRCVAASEVARPLADATPLHAALALKSKDDVVRALLRQRPRDARVASSGLYALHVALEAYEGSAQLAPATILSLLEKNREAASVPLAEADPAHPVGGFALHAAVHASRDVLVVSGLLQAFPRAARETDLRGELPIHTAMRLGASDAVCAALVDAFPEAAKMPYPAPLQVPLHDVHANLQSQETPRAMDDAPEKKKEPLTKQATLSSPTLLVAALLLRRRAYGALRCAGRTGRRVAKLLEARSAPLAIFRAFPGAAAAHSECMHMRPLHVAVTVGASVAVIKALAREPESHSRDGNNNLPLHIAILRRAPASIMLALRPPPALING